MEGLGRDDLLLRGSRLWACGKCGFAKNFSNRCRCLECNQRPTQWILDAQAAKVRELAKQPKRADDAGTSNSAKSTPESPALAAANREVAKLRAQLAAKEAKSAEPMPSGQSSKHDEVDGDDKDAEFQRRLDDIESQIAGMRGMAKTAADPSFLLAFIENLEAQATTLRTERRACWSVPRLLDRHRARLAEREERLERAAIKVEELSEEYARVAEDLAEAKQHLQAKQEDLDAERAEVAKLEAQMPTPPANTARATAEPVNLEGPEVEKMVLDGLRRLAAAQGGTWASCLAAMQCAASAAGGTNGSASTDRSAEKIVDPVSAEDKDAKDTKDPEKKDTETEQAPMDLEETPNQNAQVPKAQALVAAEGSGQSLQAVPPLQKRGATGKAAAGPPPKLTKRG